MEEKLRKMKQLLEMDVTNESKDEILLHYYERAKRTIHQYCNVNELSEYYQNTHIDLAVYFYKHRNADGLQRKSEGERTLIFEEGIPSHIKSALPLPRIQVGGYRV